MLHLSDALDPFCISSSAGSTTGAAGNKRVRITAYQTLPLFGQLAIYDVQQTCCLDRRINLYRHPASMVHGFSCKSLVPHTYTMQKNKKNKRGTDSDKITRADMVYVLTYLAHEQPMRGW